MALTLLSNALRQAVRQFFSADQATRFLAASKPKRLRSLFALALGTGMRQGELLGLRWDAIDFERDMVTVRHSLAEVKSVFILKEPKRKRSRRTFKLPAFVVESLKEHQAAMAKKSHGSAFCFVTKNGNHIGKSSLTRQVFKPILKAAKLPQVKFHSLRHSHASALLQDGTSIKAVSQRLGHSTVELTLRVYFHLLPDADESLAALTDKLFA